MTKLTIRDVPDSTRDILAERAQQQRQSLSAYIAGILEREAATPSMNDMLATIAAGPRISDGSEQAVEVIREIRDAS